mmetsp:Transcript_47408/g.92497  ORF Transcript_47408/g.92497 Transcript_47408/m.92497 type:complete len:515 (+) Transcript_47408:436-1980(+)
MRPDGTPECIEVLPSSDRPHEFGEEHVRHRIVRGTFRGRRPVGARERVDVHATRGGPRGFLRPPAQFVEKLRGGRRQVHQEVVGGAALPVAQPPYELAGVPAGHGESIGRHPVAPGVLLRVPARRGVEVVGQDGASQIGRRAYRHRSHSAEGIGDCLSPSELLCDEAVPLPLQPGGPVDLAQVETQFDAPLDQFHRRVARFSRQDIHLVGPVGSAHLSHFIDHRAHAREPVDDGLRDQPSVGHVRRLEIEVRHVSHNFETRRGRMGVRGHQGAQNFRQRELGVADPDLRGRKGGRVDREEVLLHRRREVRVQRRPDGARVSVRRLQEQGAVSPVLLPLARAPDHARPRMDVPAVEARQHRPHRGVGHGPVRLRGGHPHGRIQDRTRQRASEVVRDPGGDRDARRRVDVGGAGEGGEEDRGGGGRAWCGDTGRPQYRTRKDPPRRRAHEHGAGGRRGPGGADPARRGGHGNSQDRCRDRDFSRHAGRRRRVGLRDFCGAQYALSGACWISSAAVA